MWRNMGGFISTNWLDILLVIVGASAFFIYWAQERRKVSEAASLIVMQVEDLLKRIREIGSYISEGNLNDTAADCQPKRTPVPYSADSTRHN